MPSSCLPALRRAATVGALLALTVPMTGALGGVALAAEPVVVSTSSPQPLSSADDNGVGANQSGPYDSTRDGSPSGNGVGDGVAAGKPCAGCVGAADNKNPQGQLPDAASDGNRGFECDANSGVGRSNPAHTGCTAAAPTTSSAPPAEAPAPTQAVTQPSTRPATEVSDTTQAPAAAVAPVTPVAPPAEPAAESQPAQGQAQAPGQAPVEAPVQAPVTETPAARIPVQAPAAEVPAEPTLGAGTTEVTASETLAGVVSLPAVQAPSVTAQAQARPVALAPTVDAPAAVTRVPAVAGPAALPFTGGESVVLALLGGVLVLTGGAAALAGRRPVTA